MKTVEGTPQFERDDIVYPTHEINSYLKDWADERKCLNCQHYRAESVNSSGRKIPCSWFEFDMLQPHKFSCTAFSRKETTVRGELK